MADQQTEVDEGAIQRALDRQAETEAREDNPDELGDAGRKAIREERRARRDAERRAAEAEAARQELLDQGKTEQQKLMEERDTLKARVPGLEGENLKLRVALKKGLVGDRAFIADRLRGSTEEELEKDADALLEQLRPSAATDFDNGVRTSTATAEDMNALMRRAAGRG